MLKNRRPSECDFTAEDTGIHRVPPGLACSLYGWRGLWEICGISSDQAGSTDLRNLKFPSNAGRIPA